MAIDFENVTGNQSSANVLAQINNNFTKINSNPVAKADFATNADTVDNKHASELIPGAATFLDSIISLDSLSVGRYFCTQTRQGWEPVTETGSRTFLIEVSLNTSNDLKNYKINYIAGAGAGESYYSDYSSGSIRWNSIKTTYDDKDRAGRVTTYDDMIVYSNKEGNSLMNGDLIAAEDGTGNYYRIKAHFVFSHYDNDKNYWNLSVEVFIYDSNFSLIKNVQSSPRTIEYQVVKGEGIGEILRVYINRVTGDIIVAASGHKTGHTSYAYENGYFYFSTATQTWLFTTFSNVTIIKYYSGSESFSVTAPSYWYNNYFGVFSNYRMYYVELSSNRSSVLSQDSIGISNGNLYLIGQKNNYIFMITHDDSSIPYFTRVDITTRSKQTELIPGFTSTSTCIGGEIDGDYIYFAVQKGSSHKVFKYSSSLSLVSSSPSVTGSFSYFMASKNYVAILNSSTPLTQVFSKSDLSISSSYNKDLYMTGHYNLYMNRICWFSQTKHNNFINGIPLGEDYVLYDDEVYFYNGNRSCDCPLYSIINIANGVTIGYFANPIVISTFNENVPCYFDDMGLIFRGKYLDISKIEYLLKNFREN